MERLDGRYFAGCPSNVTGLSFPGTLFLARVDGRSPKGITVRFSLKTTYPDLPYSLRQVFRIIKNGFAKLNERMTNYGIQKPW
jgi:hypothetical protein